MKKIILFILFGVIPIGSYSQNIGSLNFIHDLDNKPGVTVEDTVAFFLLTLDKKPGKFEENIDTLVILMNFDKKKYKRDSYLTRGMLAHIIARYLDLKDSALYHIFGTERYAFKACVAEGIMDNDQSEWDRVTGSELIEIMEIIQKRKGE